MYKQITFFCLFFGAIMLHAQNKNQIYQIIGQAVETSNGKGIPYTTITVLNDSSKVLKRISSDTNGKFTFNIKDKRKYAVVLSLTGYQEKKVKISVDEVKTDLGKISMVEGVVMKEVSIVAQKPLVKVDVDKLTYSVESDPDANTFNTLDMLRKIPMITVDAEDNVTLNGQSNFKVLMNGKSSSLMSNNFKDVIRSLPANTIKDIEVITNPSSKYDAEGVGGIINIITSKKKITGYNGSVNSGFDTRGSWNGGLYLAAKINKFSFSARYSENHNKQPKMTYNSERTNFLSDVYYISNSSGSSIGEGRSHNFSGDISYDIDSKNLLSASFWAYSGNSSNNTVSSTNTLNSNNVQTQYFENNNRRKSNYSTLSGNIDYQRTFKKPNKTFTISYKLDNSPNTSNSESNIINTFNYAPYQQQSATDAFTREQTIQVDYYDPLSEMHNIECGLKTIYRQNNNNSDTYLLNQTTNTWDYSASKSDELDYDQCILSAYVGYVFRLKNITLKSGLRTELTWNNAISSSDTMVKFSNKFQNLVPYITLNYQLKSGRNIKISYTQRLNRPGLWYLNPYVNNSDPQNISFGNPNLKSEVSNTFELGYSTFTPKLNINLTGRGAFTNNSIQSISSVNANGIRSSTYKNIGTNRNIMLNFYCSYRFSEKFNIYTNESGYYAKMEAKNGYTIDNKGFGYSGNIGARFILWKNGSISTNGGIYSPEIMLQGKSSFYYSSSIGFSQLMLGKKLIVSMSISNPLSKIMSYSFIYNDPSYSQHSENAYHAQMLRLNVAYNFGKMGLEVKKAKRGILNDDIKTGGENN
jgi:outer membrane receptor protein involved in Fe transport